MPDILVVGSGLAGSVAARLEDVGAHRPVLAPAVATEEEADSVEMLIGSRDQPGAKNKGRKLERAEAWRRRCESMSPGRRDFPHK